MENTIVIGVDFGQENFIESMEELKQLVHTANGLVVYELIQKREKVRAKTFIGKGKIEELAGLVRNLNVDVVVFNHELTGSQLRNIEEIVGCRVVDRTNLILDIFAIRATTKEGKLQVKLAKLLYRLPRLEGFYTKLSRVAGGIGTRGLGEQQLELDRRSINREIVKVRRQLKRLKRSRLNTYVRRRKSNLKIVSLVGYTNSGKSTILNRLVDETKQVIAEDMLFSTVDTSMRRVRLPNSEIILMSDTVGFISNLPTLLIESFKSTLEEVIDADLIVMVVDGSHSNVQEQVDTTLDILRQLKVIDKPILLVLNKMDLLETVPPIIASETELKQIAISALSEDGINRLLYKIEEIIF